MALALVLILLGVGALLLTPTLNYTSTALKAYRISRDTMWVQNAVEAITRQALWMLQYDNTFQCDPPLAPTTKFADCVATKGSWTLTTQVTGGGDVNYVTHETRVERVNNQDVTVTVEVPGTLIAPTPTPPPLVSGACLYGTVTRQPTWVKVGAPLTYTFTVTNCSTNVTGPALRRIKALLPPSFSYVLGSTTVNCSSPSDCDPPSVDNIPEEGVCDTLAPEPDYFPCEIAPGAPQAITDGSLLENWPDGTNNFSGSGSVRVTQGQSVTWRFQATPNTWGVFYVESILCYFASPSGDPGPCKGNAEDTKRSGKVAPVVVGMFNIKGKGKGYAYGASAKLDSAGSVLISQQNQ